MDKKSIVIKILITLVLLFGTYRTLSYFGWIPTFETPNQRLKVAEELAALDNYGHSTEQFLSILNDLHDKHPKYSTLKIGDAIARTWNGFKEGGYDTSAYVIATGIKRLSEEAPGADLPEVIATYMLRRIFRSGPK